MTDTFFRSWQERLAAAAGTLTKRIRYTRKSTESTERQVASHVQQNEAADMKWGVIEDAWWWRDSRSGTTFDRPGFQDMLAFCRANKRPKADPGIIEVYDPSRFARVLDSDGKPDLMAFQNMFNELEILGWPLHFVSRDRTGNLLVDSWMITLDAFNSSAYSEKLSNDVTRGCRAHTAAGWWTHGEAPWGTKRIDTRADNRVLKKGELSTPGGGGTILGPDEGVLVLWEQAAKLILGGRSLDATGAWLHDEKHLRGPRGGRLGHRSIRNWLTNIALIGFVEYLAEVKGGRPERCLVRAQWEPMVDVELFEQLGRRLSGHSRAPKARVRRRRELYPLTLRCAHCGGEYNGGRLSARQGRERVYTHAKPKARMEAVRFMQVWA